MNSNKKTIIIKSLCSVGIFILGIIVSNTPIFLYIHKMSSSFFCTCNIISLIGIVFCTYVLVKKSFEKKISKMIKVLYTVMGVVLFISSEIITYIMIPLCQSNYNDEVLASMIRQTIISCSLVICGLTCFKQIKTSPDNFNAVVMLILLSNNIYIYKTHGSLIEFILLIIYSLLFLSITVLHLHLYYKETRLQ